MEIYSARERKQAFMDFAKKKEDFEVTFIPATFDVKDGYIGIKKYLEKHGKNFTAIFFANDWMAFGGIKALREAGFNYPEDVSIVGFDDSTLAKYLYPSLTTIKQPFYEMGLNAAKLLIEKLEGINESKVKRRVILPTKLIIRDSVRKL
jgi:LacI family transcriptional regulator